MEIPLYTGQIPITVFSLLGYWRPLKLNTKWLINLYQIYSLFMITIHAIFIFTVLIYFKDVWQDVESFILNTLYFFALIGAFIKELITIIKRNLIIDIQERLLDKVCQPRDSYETEILQKQSRICRLNEIIFLLLLTGTGLIITVVPLFKGNVATLPVETWYPYSLESRTSFGLTYIFQSITLIVCVSTSASMEGLLLTFILQICAQLELLFHRLELLPHLTQSYEKHAEVCVEEKRFIADCTRHHIHIYLLGHHLNNLFGIVIFSQFFWSMIGICTTIYELTSSNLSDSTYWFMIFALVSVSTQTFLYCFYGQLILQKSVGVRYAIQQMDWTVLTNRTKKDLLIMMMRAVEPIVLHDFTVVEMSWKTFVNIAKSAYSAYNLLNNTF